MNHDKNDPTPAPDHANLTEAWEEFISTVYPGGTFPQQYDQLQRAFFAGCFETCAFFDRLARNHPTDPKIIGDKTKALWVEIADTLERHAQKERARRN